MNRLELSLGRLVVLFWATFWAGESMAAEEAAAKALSSSPVAPVVVEAETGKLGASFSLQNERDVEFIRVGGSGKRDRPGAAGRMVDLKVRFPRAGRYELYARLRVGPGGADADSFFIGRGFGPKDPREPRDWAAVNGLASVGYSRPEDIVRRGGIAQRDGWNWLNISSFVDYPESLVYEVSPRQLEQTFQVAAREGGLDLDKLAFAPAGVAHTVADLDLGRAGRPPRTGGPPEPFTPKGPALAAGKAKYLGSAHSASQGVNFEAYFNQVTPENGGNWGIAEATQDVMVWEGLDAAYQLARNRGLPFRLHALVWGNQQPAWVESLPPQQQRREIEQWFAALAERYPAADYVEVVNEPLHDPPDEAGDGGGNYLEALGGRGETGWDWVLESFRLARSYFPRSRLVLNEYGIVDNPEVALRYREIVALLQSRGLVDAIGLQCHGFSTRASVETMRRSLDLLAATGLPLLVTELDIDGTDDAAQVAEYQRVFPLFWEHPAVQGVTLWGHRPGMWRTAQGAFLAHDNGAERPALRWLRRYVRNEPPRIVAGQIFSVHEGAVAGTPIGSVLASDAGGTQLGGFQVVGGSGAPFFSVDPDSGSLSLNSQAELDHEATELHELSMVVRDEYTSSPPTRVRIEVVNLNDSRPRVVSGQALSLGSASGPWLGRVLATDRDDLHQPGFTQLDSFRIVGGSGAALFAIHPTTGHLWLRHPDAVDWSQASYALDVTVTDGRYQSLPGRVVVRIPERFPVCFRGHTLSVERERVWRQLARGAKVGSCVVRTPR